MRFLAIVGVILITVASILPVDHEHFTLKSKNEEHRFNKNMIRHGLNYDVAVIYEDDEMGLYFIRDGKKCKFLKGE